MYSFLETKPQGKRPLGIPRHRWEDNINTNLKVTGWGVDWINLPQDCDKCPDPVNMVMKLRVA